MTPAELQQLLVTHAPGVPGITAAVAHAGDQVCGIDRYSARPDPPAVRYGATIAFRDGWKLFLTCYGTTRPGQPRPDQPYHPARQPHLARPACRSADSYRWRPTLALSGIAGAVRPETAFTRQDGPAAPAVPVPLGGRHGAHAGLRRRRAASRSRSRASQAGWLASRQAARVLRKHHESIR